MTCSLCDDPAAGRFRLSRGCVAFPDDREQFLCLSHVCKSQPLGTFELVEDLRPEGAEGVFGRGGPWP